MVALSAFTAVSGAEKPRVVKSPFPYFKLEEMRDLVLLSLLYDSAARAQELCDLKVGSIKFGQTTKVKLVGKGSKAREIPISHEVANLLRYHIKENDFEGRREEHLFASQLGGKMTTACISNLADKYVTEAKNAYPNLFPQPKVFGTARRFTWWNQGLSSYIFATSSVTPPCSLMKSTLVSDRRSL